jgi:phage terminase large subunit-like protein
VKELTPELIAGLSDQDRAIVEQYLDRKARRKFYAIKPYDWQQRFFDAGSENIERCLCAGNRTGKTFCTAYETTCHVTGEYPEWWTGWRVKKPILAWVSSLTNETSRDIVQKELLGEPNKLGTGMIPGNMIKKVTYRQAGIQHVADMVTIQGKFGLSTIQFKTAEQGREKFQGTAPDWIWQDEEPRDYGIFTECRTRLMTSGGRLTVTYTPLMGETDLWKHFHEGGPKIYMQGATWDQAPHLSDEDKAVMLASLPPHERDTRSKGVPMAGEGAVFPVGDDDIKTPSIEIPKHWARLCGVDFGFNHYAAGAWIAWDRDADTVYVYDCYRIKRELAPYHASRIKQAGDWIPVAWPHDGTNTEKSGGKTIARSYQDGGVNMLTMSARYEDGKGGAQPVEPIVMEINQMMKEGRFKVFSHLHDWFEEKRSYYREKGKIPHKNDDIMKATMYAVMMRRYAATEQAVGATSIPYMEPLVATG